MITKGEVAARLGIGAALIVEHGHWKGSVPDLNRGGSCLVTSLDGPEAPYCHDALKIALGGSLRSDIGLVYEWNDRPETTREDAVQLMMTTAEKVRTGEIKLEGVS